LLTKVRTLIHEEISLLTVLYFPFRARTPYRSAHLEGAESEKVIPAGHYLMANPETVAEIKRILEEHIGRRARR
jgi:hypothetical protein